MENINSEWDIILKWIYYLSKHLSEQELTSHMSLRTKRGRFSENFPILNWNISIVSSTSSDISSNFREYFIWFGPNSKSNYSRFLWQYLQWNFFKKHEKNLMKIRKHSLSKIWHDQPCKWAFSCITGANVSFLC